MSEPLSDYQRWSYSIADPMVKAGEDIRWVPRRLVSSVALPGNDFYLFDDRLAVFLLYAGNGLGTGKISSSDPADIRLCRSAFEAAWKLSIPHSDYDRPSSSAKQAQKALGARLREIRKDAGLSGRALAAATGQHFTRVSKIENGVQHPSDQDIRVWCHACAAGTAAPRPDRYRPRRRVRLSGIPAAGSRRDETGPRGAHTAAYERTRLFRIYEHNVIPGLFQTAAYTAAHAVVLDRVP